jgi:hypothetical protein
MQQVEGNDNSGKALIMAMDVLKKCVSVCSGFFAVQMIVVLRQRFAIEHRSRFNQRVRFPSGRTQGMPVLLHV